jgi:hypothetical protein
MDIFGRRARRENEDLRKAILWATGRDTGLSSRFMARFLCTGQTYGPGKGSIHDYAYPHDGGDLGRCFQFIDLMGWRHRVSEMAAAGKEWAGLVAIWDELRELYELAAKEPFVHIPPRKGKARDDAMAAREASANTRLYRRMKEVMGDGA